MQLLPPIQQAIKNQEKEDLLLECQIRGIHRAVALLMGQATSHDERQIWTNTVARVINAGQGVTPQYHHGDQQQTKRIDEG